MTNTPAEPWYPESQPYKTGRLAVGSGHELYFEEFGNPQGKPIVYLHGGPGAGHAAYFHRFFDPQAFRIIVYDQRGAGQSTPFGETKDNSPDLLVGDLEKLRVHLGAGKLHVFGGSWGSTLSLLYAQAYPANVETLTLRGIFMMRQKELDLFYKAGDTLFPEEFNKLKAFLPEAERGDILTSYYNRIANPDPAISIPACRVWTRYESSTCHLLPPSDADLASDTDNFVIGMARMETHFFINHKFTPDDRILKNVGTIRHIPTLIVQGHYDAVCPPVSAWELKQAFPEAHLEMVIAGHSASEPAIKQALVAGTNRIRDFGSPLPRPQEP